MLERIHRRAKQELGCFVQGEATKHILNGKIVVRHGVSRSSSQLHSKGQVIISGLLAEGRIDRWIEKCLNSYLDLERGIWFGGYVFVDEDEKLIDMFVNQSRVPELGCLEVRSTKGMRTEKMSGEGSSGQALSLPLSPHEQFKCAHEEIRRQVSMMLSTLPLGAGSSTSRRLH